MYCLTESYESPPMHGAYTLWNMYQQECDEDKNEKNVVYWTSQDELKCKNS